MRSPRDKASEGSEGRDGRNGVAARVAPFARSVCCVLLTAVSTAPVLLAQPAQPAQPDPSAQAVGGQLEVHAAERAEALARIELEDVPLRRHLVETQRLAIWLPEEWGDASPAGKGSVAFQADGDLLLVISRFEAPPGSALVPIFQQALAGSRKNGGFETVESVRRFELAGRDAVEAAGIRTTEKGVQSQRLVVSMPPDHSHFRLVVLVGTEEPAALDRTLVGLVRDWTPLDGGAWSPALERQRRRLLEGDGSVPIEPETWAERNRLFDAMARPEAIGQEWVEERLQAFAAADPRLLLDGLFHHHPRVRIACLEALDPTALEEPMRTAFYVAAMADSDPAVRDRAARRLVASSVSDGAASSGDGDGDADLVSRVLARTLEVDSEEARSAAFQLLAAAPPARRTELVQEAFAERRQDSEATQAFLVTVLGTWGPRDEAIDRQLSILWKISRSDRVRRAAWFALARDGDQAALAAARDRLDDPLADSPVPLPAAARWTAVYAAVDDGGAPWKALAKSLADTGEGAGEDKVAEGSEGPKVPKDLRDDLETAGKTLDELADYLDALPAAAGAAQECPALRTLALRSDESAWATRRRSRLGCAEEESKALVRASIPRPGPYAFGLLDLLGRLQLGSELHNQIFQAAYQAFSRKLDRWAGDPVTTASTGIDLEAPWELSWADRAQDGGDSSLGSATWRLSASNPDRLLGTVLRAGSGPVDLDRLAQGVFSSHAMALVPVALTALWMDEQRTVTGSDENGSTPAPTETYVALEPTDRSSDDTGAWVLHRLEIGDEGPDWRRSHLRRHGTQLTVTDASGDSVPPDSPIAPTAQAGDSSARIEVDLAAVIDRLKDEGEVSDALGGLAGSDLAFSAGTAFESDAIATDFRIDGLPEDWLAVAEGAEADRFRAPSELLPAACLAWTGLQANPAALAARLGDLPATAFEDLKPRSRRRLLRFVEGIDGEAGLAVVGVPDPHTEKPAEAWQDRLVLYVAVDPHQGERLLRRESKGRERHGDRRMYRLNDRLLGTQVGRFLVLGSNPELLAELGRAPFLASSSMYRRVTSRAPSDAILLAGWDTDRLADAVEASVGSRDGGERSTFAVEVFRALGGVAGWLGRREGALVGELSTDPRLQSEATRARVRQLASYGDLAWGSVQARGLPAEAIDGIEPSVLEVTLRLPRGVSGVTIDWANERLEQQAPGPDFYRFVSHAGTPLPETSDLTLPITAPELRPYARNEENLDLDSEEIKDLAETIRAGETDPAKIVQAIAAWAHDTLEYKVVEDSVSTEQVLATRQADCTEYSQLTIALARSLGIPARGVHGLVIASEAAYFHRWVEVYLGRWYEIDPTWGVVAVPATHLRVPVDDSRFLASMPGARFTVEAVRDDAAGGAGGSGEAWARRLPETAAAGSDRLDVAANGETVVVAWAAPAEEGTGKAEEEASGPGAIVSEDGGLTFHEIAAPDARLGRLLGGHGRILWLGAGGGAGARGQGVPAVYALDGDRQWRRLRLPSALAAGGTAEATAGWTFGLRPEGYLALAAGSDHAVLLDRDLASPREVPLPEGGTGEWLLARAGGLLVRSPPAPIDSETGSRAETEADSGAATEPDPGPDPGPAAGPGTGLAAGPGAGAITVYRWRDGGWAEPVTVDDSADFEAVGVRRSDELTEVLARQRPGGRLMRLIIGADSQTRRAASDEEASAFTGAARSEAGEWSVWTVDQDVVLVHRPPETPDPETPTTER